MLIRLVRITSKTLTLVLLKSAQVIYEETMILIDVSREPPGIYMLKMSDY